ncbi:hypothetical protein V6N13_019266 [Hibiscus sabdariffa]
MGGGAWSFLVGGAICLVNSVNERDLNLLTSYTEIIAIVGLQRGIPSKRESSTRVDYVPALCTHRPSLLPIEWSGEVFGSRRRGRTTRERVIKHQREGVWSLHCAPSPPCPGDTGTRVPVAKRTTPGVNYAKESE